MMDGSTLNIKKWNIIYPVYINSKKTIAEGRRIAAERACENPTCIEINDCCSHLKIPCAVEVFLLLSFWISLCWLIFLTIFNFFIFVYLQLDKAYPRDFMQRGRVRVMLKREDGSPYNPAIATSKNFAILI